MLEKEFEYYLKNQDALVKQYNGKVLVIIGENVVGAYKDETEALRETSKDHKVGTFLMQRCSPGNEAYTQTFHSRVIFA